MKAVWFAGVGVGAGLGVGAAVAVGVAVGTGVAVGEDPGVGVGDPPGPPIIRGSKLLSIGSAGLNAPAIDCQGTYLKFWLPLFPLPESLLTWS
jgi:hypothetical protein